ncbi:restriction endonuclease [Rhodococcus sp. IC4_135]|uniref:restriction endonuclease n=1 Tax=Rhodococcus sp. IC4_135 TaxID=2715537 RepID=UPI0019816F7A|nr:restriction endonuclease [Rhodococcus sp. IC4_135]
MTSLSHQQAELAMASAMRKMGFNDARAHPGGPDGGIDVLSSRAIAQVKMHRSQVGRPDLQRLYGARGRDLRRSMLFFSLSGYSSHAVKYAADVEIALFTFDSKGAVQPYNSAARSISKGAKGLGSPSLIVDEHLAWFLKGIVLITPTSLFLLFDLSVPVLDTIFALAGALGVLFIVAAIGGFMKK